MWFIVLLVLIFLVAAVLTSPWRRPADATSSRADEQLRRAAAEVEDLEAARDAKYREIRDTELDRETGKLSDADFAAVNAGLRAEAIELLKGLDRAQRRLDKATARAAEEQVTDGIDLNVEETGPEGAPDDRGDEVDDRGDEAADRGDAASGAHIVRDGAHPRGRGR